MPMRASAALSPSAISRRAAFRVAARVAARVALLPALAGALTPALLRAQRLGGDPPKHPEPRPDVTAEHVLPDDAVPKKYKDAYQAAREHPEILDGLYCHCDCEKRDGRRSLLSCFESEMPQHCGVCSGEARLAAKLRQEGKGLEEIRAAVDERYG